MAMGRLEVEWDAISIISASALNAAGAGIDPMDIHPLRQVKHAEHDITVLKKLLAIHEAKQ